ncbi:MAG: hypothetical protein C0621_07310 [Desulfuromonas sp.]|nr:MAG: hypothetical protein C0621_07310 [Desulfuromonas sp.]
MKRLWALLTTLTLLCGCSLIPSFSPQDPAELREKLSLALLENHFEKASNILTQLLRSHEAGSEDSLLQGELRQRLNDFEGAARHYDKALSQVQGEERNFLRHRLGTLFLLNLGQEEKVLPLMDHLGKGPARRTDLEALMLLKHGDARKALVHLNTIINTPLPKSLAAEILYHAALAYWQLHAYKECSEMLYKALGLSNDSILLNYQIEILWRKLEVDRKNNSGRNALKKRHDR